MMYGSLLSSLMRGSVGVHDIRILAVIPYTRALLVSLLPDSCCYPGCTDILKPAGIMKPILPHQPDAAVKGLHEDEVSRRTVNFDAPVENDIFGDYPSVYLVEAVIQDNGTVWRIDGAVDDGSAVVEVYIAVLRVYADDITIRVIVYDRIVEVDVVPGKNGPDAGEYIAVKIDVPIDINSFVDVHIAVEALACIIISTLLLGELLYLFGKIGHLYVAAERTLFSDVHMRTVQRDPSDGVKDARDNQLIMIAVIAETIVGMDVPSTYDLCRWS